MSGHINKSEPHNVAFCVRQLKVRESNVNGDAAPLLFVQPVSIDPGQRFHERCLAVINMTRCAYNNALLRHGISLIGRKVKSAEAPLGGVQECRSFSAFLDGPNVFAIRTGVTLLAGEMQSSWPELLVSGVSRDST